MVPAPIACTPFGLLLLPQRGVSRKGAADPRSMVAPIVYSVPVQLLAYCTAMTKGTNVDQPRNLAKSVTVE